MSRWDVIVVGAGSGGIGAAVAAGRGGARTLLLEAAGILGGTVVRAGVDGWEPVVGATGLPRELYELAGAGAACTSCLRHPPETPYGLWVPDRRITYADTLRRSGLPAQEWHGVIFTREAYLRAASQLLASAGVTLWTASPVRGVVAHDQRIDSIVAERGGSAVALSAATYIDATGDALIAQQAGATTRLGPETRDIHGEPSAPTEPLDRLNGVSLIYRVAPTDDPRVEPLPDDVPPDLHRRAAHCVRCPDGSVSINTLPTLDGAEARRLGPAGALAEARRSVLAHWHCLQSEHGWADHRLVDIAPALGVREGPRLVGRTVLTQHDLLAGLRGQTHADIIALADHPCDVHGAGGGVSGVGEPYGVPFGCLVPRELGNLQVACRGASFSSLAASSCRLSRTMMQLGQAAGTAAALARRLGVDVADTPPAMLRQRLREAGVQLEWDGWHVAVPSSLRARVSS